MKIVLYNNEYRREWDDLIRESKNGTFLFYRDFIEYHRDRFRELSFMFYDDKNRLLAVMPGQVENKFYYSHGGLTYGGLVMSDRISARFVLDIFERLIFTLRQQGFDKFIYKAIPHIYHRQPAEEDLYALFRLGAIFKERNISSTINLQNTRIEYSGQRKNSIKRSVRKRLFVEKSEDYKCFWNILTLNLHSKYKKMPVHTIDEIEYLKDKFPENIHLYVTRNTEGNMLAGCVLFETNMTVHVQYIAATDMGKRDGAVDCLVNYIIGSGEFSSKMYFDYGISTENGGQFLNEKLIYQKEGFGAKATLYDIYEIIL